jgi:tetratricopeptide (TPR) repeat protein
MMINSKRALALALAFGGFSAVPALAQYQSMPQQQSTPRTEASPKAAPAPAADERKYDLSIGGRKAIAALQKVVNAKETAAIPPALAAANAAAKTKDDKYVIGQLQLKAAVDSKDSAGITSALETMLASGAATPQETVPLHFNLGKQYYVAKQYDRAASEFEQTIAVDPNHSDALILLAETRRSQGRIPDAVAMLQKAIAARSTAGQKAPEDWYKHAVQLAYDAKLPSAIPISRDWITAYPAPANWNAALRIYQKNSGLDNDTLIDLMRLQRATGGLAGESDYYLYANTALQKGYPGEAQAVLEEGFAAKKIDRSRAMFRDILAVANGKIAADKASLPGLEKTALAAPAARQAMVTGDVYLGYGDYAKAAALYRAALGKTGVDSNLANLRLGIALTRAGDTAGAAVALRAVSGPRADIAKYWLLYLSSRV